jgi:hypothetical protein
MTMSCQILGGASEDLNDVVLRLQQIGEACPDRLIVIHREDARFQFFQSFEDVEVSSRAPAVTRSLWLWSTCRCQRRAD